MDLPTRDGRFLRVTGTPARHGPVDGDRGPVTGFVLTLKGSPQSAVYISGDTVWYEGAAEVGQRFSVQVAILFMGAARVAAAGPAHLTFTANEGVEAVRAFADAIIIPLHYEGWEHFSESREQLKMLSRLPGWNIASDGWSPAALDMLQIRIPVHLERKIHRPARRGCAETQRDKF